MKFKNKLAIITGASTGIGKAVSVAMAKEGIEVILIARTKKKLVETNKLIKNIGGKSVHFVTDLSRVDSINKTIKKIKKLNKDVSFLINVAGIWHGANEVYANKDFETFNPQVIVDTYCVGLIAPTLLAHAFIPVMPVGSKILNVSGTFENGAKGWLPYFVSKRGIEDLTVGLAEELKNKKISVNCISPSDTATEAYKKYFPQYLGDTVAPEAIAKFVIRLCISKKAVTGKVFVLKKGRKIQEGYHT